MKSNKILILYGSTGDLTFRKIIPSLINLDEQNKLEDDFKIVAIGRRDFNKEDYLNFIKENNENIDLNQISKKIDYLKMEITVEEDYLKLKKYLEEISLANSRIVHYLAIAPDYMGQTVNYLVDNKVIVKGNNNHSLVFEKPFGNNLVEAIKLNNMLEKRLTEQQIYRIDHYLGKDIVEKIMYYRFESKLFTSIFDKNSISKIDIVLKEEDGILNRGSYFDQTGIIKDMFQGHILQLITLLTMNKPSNGKNIIKEKVNVLRKIKFDKQSLIFGQYNNYLKEKNVLENSKTETYFKGTFYVKNYYKNVPINVVTGKKMNEKSSYIKLTLKDNSEVILSMFPNSSLSIKASLKFNNINYKEVFDVKMTDYANVIDSIFSSNKHLFVSNQEVILSWKIAEEVLKEKEELLIYNEKFEEN